jgi:hypothetical protein
MDTQQKKDRLTGLLTLAGDKIRTSDCLSPEELARLVDGREEDLNGPLYAHLSSCDKCYSQWLLLKKMDEKASDKGKILRFPGKKAYKYIGSGLAVAATIALYLNITDFNNLAPQLEMSVDKGAVETEADALSTAADEEKVDFAGDTVVQPAPPSPEAVLQSHSLRGATPAEQQIQQLDKASREAEITVGASAVESLAEKETVQRKQMGEGAGAPPPVPSPQKKAVQRQKLEGQVDSVSSSLQSVPLAKEKAGRSFSVMDDKKELYKGSEEVAVSPHEFFKEQIERGCRMDDYEPEFWQQLMGEADELPTLSSVAKQETVTQLKALVAGMDETSYGKRCDTMLQILAEEKKSR